MLDRSCSKKSSFLYGREVNRTAPDGTATAPPPLASPAHRATVYGPCRRAHYPFDTRQ